MLSGEKKPRLEQNSGDFPNVAEVEGKYYPFRRPEGTFLEMMSFTLALSVKASGENEILLKQLPYMQKYIQTAPYIYEVADDSTPRFNVLYPKLRFEMEKGKVIQITAGNGCDLQPVKLASSSFSRIGSLAVSVLFILSCLAGIAMTLISMIRGRSRELASNRKTYDRLQLGSRLLGVVMITSNIMILAKFMSTFYMAFSSLRPFLMLNYLYAVLFLLIHGFSFKLESNISLGVAIKVVDRIHFLLTVLMVLVLVFCNFFTIHF